MTVRYDRKQFYKYLEDSGAVAALSRVLLKLYELKQRPKSSIKYIAEHIADVTPSLTEYESMRGDLNAMGALLAELKMNGKLNQNQLAVIDKICTKASSICKGNTGSWIEARQSQLLLPGNEIKKSNINGSQVRNIPNDSNYDQKIKDAIDALQTDAVCNSLLKNCMKMNPNLYDTYKAKQTEKEFIACIASGLDIHRSMIGVYAAVDDAYDNFPDLFDPIISEYHGFNKGVSPPHPTLDWGDPDKFNDIDQKGKFIVSTRIRCIRNVKDYSLVPKVDKNGLKELCEKIKVAFHTCLMTDDLKGTWYDQSDLKSETKKELIEYGYILEFGDKFLESAGATEWWPEGRALWINDKKSFFVWINEEDHLRFISMEVGSDFSKIYKRLIQAVDLLKNELTFQRSNDFGFVTLCPSNLGNTIRTSVMVTLPKLTANPDKLENIVKRRNLEIRESAGPGSNTFEISNKRKLGLTEFDSVKELYDGIKEIIENEESS